MLRITYGFHMCAASEPFGLPEHTLAQTIGSRLLQTMASEWNIGISCHNYETKKPEHLSFSSFNQLTIILVFLS